MKNINHFNSFQELYTFLKAKPVEPKKYEEPKEEPKAEPKKTTKKRKKDAEVLQAE